MMAVLQVENGCLALHWFDGPQTPLLLECDMINELSDDEVINAAASDDQDDWMLHKYTNPQSAIQHVTHLFCCDFHNSNSEK